MPGADLRHRFVQVVFPEVGDAGRPGFLDGGQIMSLAHGKQGYRFCRAARAG
jgi:hypothetical protein